MKLNQKSKKDIIDFLSSKKVSNVRFHNNRISLRFVGETISFRVVKKRVKDVAVWDKNRNIIYYDDFLKEEDVLPVLVHECVEDFTAKSFNLGIDTEAHKIAQKVERCFVLDRKKNWRGHELKVALAWKKENKRKVGRTKFY